MKYSLFLFIFVGSFASCNTSTTEKEATSAVEPAEYYFHNLLIQWKDSVDLQKREELFELFRGMPSKIAGFEEIQIIDLAPTVSSFNTLIIQKYSSEEAEGAYQVHEDHLKIKSFGPSLMVNMTKFDYWGK